MERLGKESTFSNKKVFKFKHKDKIISEKNNLPLDQCKSDFEVEIPQFLPEDDFTTASKSSEVIANLSYKSVVSIGELKGIDYTLLNLDHCEIFLIGSVGAARLQNIINCTIWISDVKTSISIDNCGLTKLIIKGHQLRVHGSHDLEIYLLCTSTPIIENCSKIFLGPYFPHLISNFQLPKESIEIQDAKLVTKVLDFDWHKQEPSPNWSFMTNKEPKIDILIQNNIKSVGYSHFKLLDGYRYFGNYRFSGLPDEFFMNS